MSVHSVNQPSPDSHGELGGAPGRTGRSRPPLRRSLVVLPIAVVSLFGVILLLSDVRRRSVPLADAQWYAEQFQSAMDSPANETAQAIDVSTAVARAKVARMTEGAEREPERKRTSGGLALIAWTRRVPRVLLPDGYAVVFQASDGTHAVWWSTAEFNERFPVTGK